MTDNNNPDNESIDESNEKKKPWKTRIERDIIMHKDIKDSSLQGGKIIGYKLSLFNVMKKSFINNN